MTPQAWVLFLAGGVLSGFLNAAASSGSAVTLPLAIVQKFGLMTIPATLVVAYVMFGIEEIGVEIEDPFGADTNDLPLEKICDVIEQNLSELLTRG